MKSYEEPKVPFHYADAMESERVSETTIDGAVSAAIDEVPRGDELPEFMTVKLYRRYEVTDQDRQQLADRAYEYLVESLDDTDHLGAGTDSDDWVQLPAEGEASVKEALLTAVRRIFEHHTPWYCPEVGEVRVDVQRWLAESSWLKKEDRT